MKKLALFAVLAIALAVVARIMTRPNLKYFSASEFGIWWPLMNRDWLLKLDKFRELWGRPVYISGNAAGLGRHDDSDSQHNVLKWGEVRAGDVFPEGMNTAAERDRAYRIAREVGFTGIGLYTDTKRGNMLHVDVREPKRPGYVATWSRVAGEYGSISEVLA
jgi:hypothetical protein